MALASCRRMMRSTRGGCYGRLVYGIVLASLLGVACGPPTAEEIQQEFDEYVAERNHCSAATECTLVFSGCPLGCAVGVRTEYEQEVKDKAAELIDEYRSGGEACMYSCPASVVECEEGRCVAVPE